MVLVRGQELGVKLLQQLLLDLPRPSLQIKTRGGGGKGGRGDTCCSTHQRLRSVKGVHRDHRLREGKVYGGDYVERQVHRWLRLIPKILH